MAGISVFEQFVSMLSGEEVFPFRMTESDGTQAFLYHWHDEIEVLYGRSGETSVGIEGKTYVLAEGDLMIIHAGESHCIFPSGENARRMVLVFDPSFFFRHSLFEKTRNSWNSVAVHSHDWPEVTAAVFRSMLEEAYDIYRKGTMGWMEACTGLLYRMSACILAEVPEVEPVRRVPDSLRAVLKYLSEHYPENISLEQCAEALSFNASYLSDLFRQGTGVTFHEYLISLRLKHAEWLLEHSDLPIAQIAAESGFQSDQTFFRVFRARFAMSPGAYRKQHRKS